MWYRLKNAYKPETHCLDVINDAGANSTGLIKMAHDGYYSGQYWQLKSNNGDDTYCLRTWWLGPDRQLDVYSHDTFTPVLQQRGDESGQCWTIGSWGDGTWYFSNALSGQENVLDTGDDGKVGMGTKDEVRPTQRWRLEAIRCISEEGYHDNQDLIGVRSEPGI
jgi:immune inhibitor A